MIFIEDVSTVIAETGPLTHARIGWERIEGDVAASTSTAGHPASAAYTVNTYETWQPSSMPATWRIDAGSAVEVNYCGIAVHQLANCTVNVAYSNDDSSWTDIFGAAKSVTNGDPILMLFPKVSARYWRVSIAGPVNARIAHIRFGEILAMQRPLFAGHQPGPLSRETVLSSNVSERGQFLGRSVIRAGVREAFSWQHLEPDWYRDNFDPFVLDARKNPFFIAWRPVPDRPSKDDVIYGWVNDDIAPSNMGVRDFMTVSMNVDGVANYE